MRRLGGVGVLVTRPQPQSLPLCRLLEEHGATTFRLPAIEIEPAASLPELAARLEPLEPSDLLVFTSANAVRFGAALLERRQDLSLAAIGPATMRALGEAGFRVSYTPSGGFDSEHLLGEPGLQQLAGRRVVLIKGEGGRALLATELAKRGARILAIDVYRRRPARPDAALLRQAEERAAAGLLQVVTATSLEIAAALLELATPALRGAFEHTHWLVPGARVAAGLAALGLDVPLIEAASAADQDLVDALLRWRASTSGA